MPLNIDQFISLLMDGDSVMIVNAILTSLLSVFMLFWSNLSSLLWISLATDALLLLVLAIVVIRWRSHQQKRDDLNRLHRERLAAIGQFAAGVAHEIGNPITGIACLAQEIRMEHDDESLKEASDQIIAQADRVSTILQTLMSFAHIGSGGQVGEPGASASLAPVVLSSCVDDAITLLSLENRKHVLMINECDTAMQVPGDSQRLVQVFVNLLSNALHASDEGGRIIISTSDPDDVNFSYDGNQDSGNTDDRCEQQYINILVKDEGKGLGKTSVDEMFEPFYTTKAPGEGTGLGLAIVSTIVTEHNGQVKITPNSPRGTCVTISLPAA